MPSLDGEELASMASESLPALPSESTWEQLFAKILEMFEGVMNVAFENGIIRTVRGSGYMLSPD